MPKCVVHIYGNGSALLELDGKTVENRSEIEEIASKIMKNEIEAEVFYNDNKTTLYQMQGGIGAEGFGFVAPLLFNPLANLLIALAD